MRETTEYSPVVNWQTNQWLVVKVLTDIVGKEYSEVVASGMTEKWAKRIANALNSEGE